MNANGIQITYPTTILLPIQLQSRHFKLYIKLNTKGILIKARPTSNHPRVKLRCLKNDLIFILQKNHSLRSTGANCSFTYLHKPVVEIFPQETRNNGLVKLILSLHCLSDDHLRCRTFPVTKGNYKNKVELGNVSECRKFSYCYRLYFPDT